MKLIIRAILALGVLVIASPSIAQDADAPQTAETTKAGNDIYIVQMSDKPVVAYDGGIPGLSATKPRKGQKIDPNSPGVSNYVSYLNAGHDRAVGAAGGRKVYDYSYSFNGFAAALTPQQAAALMTAAGVLSVQKDELQHVNTSTTPKFLG